MSFYYSLILYIYIDHPADGDRPTSSTVSLEGNPYGDETNDNQFDTTGKSQDMQSEISEYVDVLNSGDFVKKVCKCLIIIFGPWVYRKGSL